MILKMRLVKIGNSQGIRIPKALLDQVGLTEDIELEVQGRHLVLRAARRPRDGWDELFRRMSLNHDDHLFDARADGLSSWDEEEWVWA